MVKKITFIILLCYGPIIVFAQSACERITKASIQQLPEILIDNDFNQINSIANTLMATCENSELALRLQILTQLIQKQPTGSTIRRYIEGQYDAILITRLDDAVKKDAEKLYNANPEKYQFIPLNNPIDSLIRIKARALLQSDRYALTKEEQAISYLFADYIEEYWHEMGRKENRKPTVRNTQEQDYWVSNISGAIYAGYFFPFTSNIYQKPAPVFGLGISTPMSRSFIFEFQAKMRINTGNEPIQVYHEKEIRTIKSSTSTSFGVQVGYKAMDQNNWILMPKLGVALGLIHTNLKSNEFYVDEYGYQYQSVRYNNVNTLHSTFGLTLLHRIGRKNYIGLEANYHHIPYNWDKDLITPIKSNFGSLELSFRF
ncbi:hypothetical protein ACL9RF_15710 [Sphingobacterium sp. Mn56C]|uniref:hypothetical protein n=1 Tax=Sphingobacterium sp. Mn56C TaxID=3395261 RepID=UPI003BED3C51